MPHAIDVVTTDDRPGFVAAWSEVMERLARTPGFVAAELFEKQRDIRNAHYDFVGLITGDDTVRTAQAPFPADGPHHVERTLCTLSIHLEGTADDGDGHAWLVNPFEITDAQIPDVLDMWDKAKDHMIAKRGFIDARLFRAESATARYGLVNIAEWRSADLFMAALDDKAYDRHRERSMAYSLHPSLCRRVATVRAAAATAAPATAR